MINAQQGAPSGPKERIQSLDVIRGVAILGVLAVNADGFAAPISASLKPQYWPFPNEGWTAFSYWVMDCFFHDKFVTIFSMLFGISLFLVGGELRDRQRSTYLARRLVALVGFAMLHGFGIWWGDILSTYAAVGMLMFFCRSLAHRTLLIIGVVLFGCMAARELPWSTPAPVVTASQSAATLPAIPTQGQVEARKTRIAADFAEAKSSWQGAYAVNTRSYIHQLSKAWTGIPLTLGLMMMGLSLFKSGYFAGRSTHARYKTMLVVGGLSLGAVGWLTWTRDVAGQPVWGGNFFALTLAVLVALGYVAGLVLLLHSRMAPLLRPFAATGRMAFTNYITQSLIMTSLFYGGRLGLMGEVDRPALWGIVILVWALQLVWSTLWLSRFEMGPLEWLWRWMTYGRRSPFLKVVGPKPY